MPNAASERILQALLEPAAGDSAAAAEPAGRNEPLPTLDRRVNIYLRAVHGPDVTFSPEQRARARDRVLAAMAADLVGNVRRDAPQFATETASGRAGADIRVAPSRSVPVSLTGMISRWLENLAAAVSTPVLRPAAVMALLALGVAGAATWLYAPTAMFKVASDSSRPAAVAEEKFVIQISAKATEAEMESAFRALQAKVPTVLGDRTPIIRKVELDDHNTIYRAEVGPFTTLDQASDLCTQVRREGEICLVRRN